MDIPIFLLRLAPALTMLVFGIHQIRKPEPWFEYVPQWFQRIVPTGPFMRVHGLGNVLLALFLVSGFYPLAAAWLTFIWFLTIVPNAFMDSWKTGMRDLAITISLLALIFLLS